MNVGKTLYNIYTYPINRIGLLTKKNCVDIATNVGCRLSDIEKSGKVLTPEIISNVIKKEAPHIKLPNIVTTREQAVELSVKNGCPKEIAELSFDETVNSKCIAWYSPQYKGFYVPQVGQNTTNWREMPSEIIAHELEHYLYRSLNPALNLRSLFSKFLNKMDKNTISPEEKFKRHISNPNRNIPYNIQNKLFEYFGTLAHQLDKHPADFKSGDKAVLQLLKSPAFSGLTDVKRIDAYIRSIIRANIHPQNGQKNILKIIQKLFEDEARAYKVTENVINHADEVDKITPFGVRSYVCKRASEILDKEIQIAKEYKKIRKNKYIPHIKTGLPTNSYVGKHKVKDN